MEEKNEAKQGPRIRDFMRLNESVRAKGWKGKTNRAQKWWKIKSKQRVESMCEPTTLNQATSLPPHSPYITGSTETHP